MTKRNPLLHSFVGQPLALAQNTLRELQIRLAENSDRAPNERQAAELAEVLPTPADCLVCEGVAVVELHGLMVKRSQIFRGWFDDFVFLGSDDRAQLILDLAERDDVHTIVIDADSGGGTVAGTETLSAAVAQAATRKTVVGVVNEFCASACLHVLSQCSRIVGPASCSIGSLGVYLLHVDDSGLYESFGMTKTPIYRGKYKAQHERPLDDDGREQLQNYVDQFYSQFVDTVARGRGVSADYVVANWGESQMFVGSEAIATGLMDELGTLQDVLHSVSAGRIGRAPAAAPAPPPADEDPEMKTNESGQLVDDKGKVVGSLSDLNLSADQIKTHFAPQVQQITDTAVATAVADTEKTATETRDKAQAADRERLQQLVEAVGPADGVAAFLAGDDVTAAKAKQADALKAQLEAKDKELAELRESATRRKPGFSASDAGGATGRSETPEESEEDPDAAYVEDWNKNTAGCRDRGFPSFKAYAAFRRYQERQAAAS